MRPLASITMALVLLGVSRVWADPVTLFSNAPADPRICPDVPAVNDCRAISANVISPVRFTPTVSGDLQQITFWADHAHTGTYLGQVSWYLFGDVGARPGAAPLASGDAVNLMRELVSSTQSSDMYRYSFNTATPVTLQAGTDYWFSPLVAGTLIGWAAAVPSATILQTVQINLRTGSVSSPFSSRPAFELSDVGPTPEPATLLLMSAGLAVFCLVCVRRQRSSHISFGASR